MERARSTEWTTLDRRINDAWGLAEFSWLRALPEEDLHELRALTRRREFSPGEPIFAPTPGPQEVYLLERGLVRIYRVSPEGNETTFGFVLPGELFGELAALGEYPRESFAQAVGLSRVSRIPLEPFRTAISSCPGLVIAVARQVGGRFKRIESRMEDLVFQPVRTRVERMLAELAEDFGRDVAGGVLLDLDLTQSALASLVGTTRQSVNETLAELSADNRIRHRKRQIVLISPDAQEQDAAPAALIAERV